MSHGIPEGVVPPPTGLEKEEPELTDEQDIPSDDNTAEASDEPLRDVERE